MTIIKTLVKNEKKSYIDFFIVQNPYLFFKPKQIQGIFQ